MTIAPSASASTTTRRLGDDLSARKCYFVNVHVTVWMEFFQAFRWQYQPVPSADGHVESL